MIQLQKALADAEIAAGVRIHESAQLPVNGLVFSAELLKACETNVCGKYNKSWTCPPACGTKEQQEKILLRETAFVFTTMHNLEDSFDYEGMTRGRELHTRLTLELKNRLGDDFSVYGAGSCPICRDAKGNDVCAFPLPCPYPKKQIVSIEAVGINVTELSRTADIAYNNGPNTVTYFSLVVFR
jgi:predicted metal-binding protein